MSFITQDPAILRAAQKERERIERERVEAIERRRAREGGEITREFLRQEGTGDVSGANAPLRERYSVTVGSMRLTPTMLRILKVFLNAKGEPVRGDEVARLAAIYGSGKTLTSRVINLVKKIRFAVDGAPEFDCRLIRKTSKGWVLEGDLDALRRAVEELQ
ncbi:MAG: hypothetical protein AAFW47_07170 [Pseudomonadota bacterium]